MSGYNPRSPAALGMEWRPTIQTDFTLSGPSTGLAMRIVSGATTIDGFHPYIKSVFGSPGFGAEVLSSLEPPAPPQIVLADGTVESGEHHFIGTDTGLISANWKRLSDNSTTPANLWGALNEFPPLSTSVETIVNSSTIQPNSKLQFAGRGNDTAITGKRIKKIAIVAFHRTLANVNTDRQGPRVQAYLNLSGQSYVKDHNIRATPDGRWRQPAIGGWEQNPATNQPWTLAEVNNLVSTTSTDEWGLQLDSATVAAGGYNLSMLVMVVFTTGTSGGGGGGAVGDVRMGFKYQQENPSAGWNSCTLGSTSAESANTYYWLHLYPLSAGGSFTVPILRDPRTDFRVTALATDTGFHRQAYITSISASGVIQSYQALPGSMLPILISAAGTFNAQSQAFAELSNLTEDSAATANLAQQITTTGGTPPHYASLRGPIGWATSSKPDAPLNIQIQHGANANIGTGTVLANIFVQPEDVTQQLIDRAISLGPGIDPPATTKLFVLFDSAASPGAGWKIGRADTRSDATTGPSVANIEGQSQGGQTDSQSNGTTDFDRYDMPFVLLGDPGQVGGTPAPTLPTLTATVEVAV